MKGTRNGGGAKTAAAILHALRVTPGDGAPPDKAGLYWVRESDGGRAIAVVEGVAPFMSVKLCDPWDGTRTPCKMTEQGIASLKWEGEIPLPPERTAS